MLSNTEQQEILRRRTFAIISHPDAGKTTLTEKLLLYGGAIHIAGAVKSNKIKKTRNKMKKWLARILCGIMLLGSTFAFSCCDNLATVVFGNNSKLEHIG